MIFATMSRLSFDWHVSRSVADTHKGVVLTHAANQGKVEESNTKTKEDSRPSWWPQWQEPFASSLEVQRERRGRGIVNRRASEARTSLVSRIPSFPHPPPHFSIICVGEGFTFVCIFFICVCTLFVWWDKDRRGEPGGLGLVDKTSLQLGTRTGLFQVILLPGTIQNERLQWLEEKCVAIRLWSALSLAYAAASDTHVLEGRGKSECYFKKRDIFTQHCISLTEHCHLVAVPSIIYLVPL